MQVKKESATKKYNVRLNEILGIASHVFAKKGYHKASIRDISRESGISLAGLYYYFTTKEELLFLISQFSFDSVLRALEEKLPELDTPDQKLKFLIRNHVIFFVCNLDAMKVLSHESESLSGEYYRAINDKKKRYIQIVEELLLSFHGKNNGDANSHRYEALVLFGMMNWIYTWYNPKKDDIDSVTKTITDVFFTGISLKPR